jgi:hypothetical protein
MTEPEVPHKSQVERDFAHWSKSLAEFSARYGEALPPAWSQAIANARSFVNNHGVAAARSGWAADTLFDVIAFDGQRVTFSGPALAIGPDGGVTVGADRIIWQPPAPPVRGDLRYRELTQADNRRTFHRPDRPSGSIVWSMTPPRTPTKAKGPVVHVVPGLGEVA